MVTAMNACVGSWKCGKSRAFPTFPQPLLLLFENRNPNKITTRGGEGGASDPHLPVEALFKRLVSTNLTLPKEYLGDMDERVLKDQKRRWSRSILEMIRNVCLRSMRSFHIDILSNKWMYDPEIDKLEGNLARRAIRVKKLLYKSEIDSADLKTIKQFYDTVNLNDNKDFGPASNALMAAIGEYTDVNLLLEDASVIKDLACLYKTIPENGSEIHLLDIHIDKLTNVLNKIRDGNDVTLLNNFLDDIIYQ